MKRIIFDVDNTLIPWKEEYSKSVSNAMEKCEYHFTPKQVELIYDSLHYLADRDSEFNYEVIINYFKKVHNIDIDNHFMDIVLEEQMKCYEMANPIVVDTLEYLYKKYDLVILTNWFRKCQEERLKRAGILKYFKEIYGNDEYYSKPSKKAFISALNGVKPEDTMMVGDNINVDINPAKELGINTFHVKNIEDVGKLKEML